MGCYDTVRFRCLRCNQRFTEQTKAGNCTLTDFDSQDVPLAIAASLVGESVFCPHCSAEFKMASQAPTRTEVYLTYPNGDEDE